MNSIRLAVQGGEPAFPKGPPPWPVANERIELAIRAAVEYGHWGKYDSELGESLIDQLQAKFEVQHAMACSSGTIAVELALRGVGVKAGTEVILAAYDFPGNFRAIEAIGARPVLVDLDPNSWLMDLSKIESAVSESTQAIVISHLHGHIAKMNDLRQIAEKHELSIVEDACQVPGAMLNTKPVGSLGDVGVLSFGGSKLLSAGRGGAILSNDPAILQRAKIYSNRGNDAFPLSQLQAAALIPQLESLDEIANLRHENCLRLHQLLSDSPAKELVASSGDPSVAFGSPARTAVYKFPLFVSEAMRKAFIECLVAEGISAGEGFRGFFNRTARRCRKPMDLPNSRIAAQQTVLLHHPVLLESADYLHRFAETIVNVHRFVSEQAS